MLRQINEPVVVRGSQATWPDMMGRDCCYNCGHVDPMCSQLDDWTRCGKHGRVTAPWWWCSDHLSETEAAMRAEALTTIHLLGDQKEEKA